MTSRVGWRDLAAVGVGGMLGTSLRLALETRTVTQTVLLDKIERQGAEIERLRTLVDAYRRKRAADGANGRKWDAQEHWRAEQDVRRAEGEPLMPEGDE